VTKIMESNLTEVLGTRASCQSRVRRSGTLPESLPDVRIEFIMFEQAIRGIGGLRRSTKRLCPDMFLCGAPGFTYPKAHSD